MRSAEDLDGGWVPIVRRILSPDYGLHPRQQGKEVNKLLALIDLWLLAVWKSLGDLRRGELEASQRELAERWRWDRSRVRRFLNRLEEIGEIEREKMAGAQADRIRIVHYPEVRSDHEGTAGRRGTDPPIGPHQRPTQSPEVSERSPEGRPTQATTNGPTHNIEEEKYKRAHARKEEKRNRTQTPILDRARKVWEQIQTARDEGCLDNLNLPAIEAKAFERIGGPEAVEKASRRESGDVRLRNKFFVALHELLGGNST